MRLLCLSTIQCLLLAVSFLSTFHATQAASRIHTNALNQQFAVSMGPRLHGTIEVGHEQSSTNLSLRFRGGATDQQNDAPAKKKAGTRVAVFKNLLASWGVVQVISILANAIRRLVPIAIEPFFKKDMKWFHWAMYAGWFMIMVYSEGYKAFQKKFSPLVVKRAYTLYDNPSIMNYLLAGPYSMGLFGATKKRMTVTWSITVAVFAIVGVVKKLPYPYRSIIDAGVVGGLTYGATATLVYLIRGLCGYVPDVDACLPNSPEEEVKEKKSN